MSPAADHPTPASGHHAGFWIGETDAWLLAEGKHLRPWQKLGAHPTTINGQAGVAFAVSLAYNAAGLVFAASGRLSPMVSAILMPLSSFSVMAVAMGATRLAAWRAGLGAKA